MANGRPVKEISKKQFENLCAIQCTIGEICAVLDVTDKTLTAWCKRTYKQSFSEIFGIKRLSGHASLRRTQFEHAMKNPAMAMFLGKNWLGQRDNPDLDVNKSTLELLGGVLDEVKKQSEIINKASPVCAECEQTDKP